MFIRRKQYQKLLEEIEDLKKRRAMLEHDLEEIVGKLDEKSGCVESRRCKLCENEIGRLLPFEDGCVSEAKTVCIHMLPECPKFKGLRGVF